MKIPLAPPSPSLVVLREMGDIAPDQLHTELRTIAAFRGLVIDGDQVYASFAQVPSQAIMAQARRLARDHKPRRTQAQTEG